METPEPRSWKWIQVAVVMAALIVGLVIAVWVENRPITPVNVKALPVPTTEARRMNLPDIIPSVAPDTHAPPTTQVAGGQLYDSQIDGTTGAAPESSDTYKPAGAATPSADALVNPNYGGASAAVSGQTSSGPAPTTLPSESSPSSYTPAPEGASSTLGQPGSVPVDPIPGTQSGASLPGSQSPAPDGSAGVPAAYSPSGTTPTTGSPPSATGGF